MGIGTSRLPARRSALGPCMLRGPVRIFLQDSADPERKPMAKKNRPSVQKREREQKKRDRERVKAEKVATRRERKQADTSSRESSANAGI